MNIVFHAHKAEVPAIIQQRAEVAVRKLGTRLRRAVDASVRFAGDGRRCRVEVQLRTPRRRPIVASGEGWQYDLALAEAVEALAAHVAHARAARERRIRRGAPRPALSRVVGLVGEEMLEA